MSEKTSHEIETAAWNRTRGELLNRLPPLVPAQVKAVEELLLTAFEAGVEAGHKGCRLEAISRFSFQVFGRE